MHSTAMYGQPGVDDLEPRAVEGGRSDGDECDDAWVGASRHADQYEQSRVYVATTRPFH